MLETDVCPQLTSFCIREGPHVSLAGSWALARSCCECSVLCAAAPGIIILLAGVILPESPSSLAEQNDIVRARKVSGHAHYGM